MKGICLICGTDKKITQHHLTLGPKKGNRTKPIKVPICRKCHDIIEAAKVYVSRAKRLRESYQRGYEKGYGKALNDVKKFIKLKKLKKEK